MLTSALVLRLGLRAISDDDFSRVVIAQNFAVSPHWDASGTSWLPAPFWILGGALRVFGRDLEVARFTAIALGCASALLVYQAGVWLELSRAGRLFGASLACLLPWFVWVGVTPTPEALTGGLLTLGAAASSSTAPSRRVAGAAALAVAALSRYEAWPVAILFAVFCARDAARSHSAAYGTAAALAIAAPGAWLLHGFVAHGDALFFVTRVVSYKRALGGPSQSFWERVLEYPWKLLQPLELWLIAAATVASVLGRRASTADVWQRFRRPALLMLGLLLFLILGQLRDGAPTHHAERALLGPWLLLALAIGEVVARAFASFAPRPRLLAIALFGCASAALAFHATRLREQGFADRSAEIDIGERARRAVEASSQRVRPDAPLLINTSDFGYFAVMAAFGRPEATRALGHADPRMREPPERLDSRERLQRALARHHAAFIVLPLEHAAAARAIATERAQNSRFALFERSGPAF